MFQQSFPLSTFSLCTVWRGKFSCLPSFNVRQRYIHQGILYFYPSCKFHQTQSAQRLTENPPESVGIYSHWLCCVAISIYVTQVHVHISGRFNWIARTGRLSVYQLSFISHNRYQVEELHVWNDQNRMHMPRADSVQTGSSVCYNTIILKLLTNLQKMLLQVSKGVEMYRKA